MFNKNTVNTYGSARLELEEFGVQYGRCEKSEEYETTDGSVTYITGF